MKRSFDKQKLKRRMTRYKDFLRAVIIYWLLIFAVLLIIPPIIASNFGMFVYLVVLVITIITLAYILITKRELASKWAWFIIVAAVPVLGLFIFFFIGYSLLKKKNFRKKKKTDIDFYKKYVYKDLNKDLEHDYTADIVDKGRLIEQMTSAPLYENNRAQVLEYQAVYDAMYEAVQSAEHHIHMEMYIIRDDELTRPILNIMMEKAQRGVQVRILADVVGTIFLENKFIEELINSGIEFVLFAESKAFYLDHMHANHRKLLIVDGRIGFTGGYNMGKEYVTGYPKKKMLWRDVMMQLEGSSLQYLQNMFLTDWFYATKEDFVDNEVDAYFHNWQAYEEPGLFQLVADGPDTEDFPIKNTFYRMINNAKDRVWITTPYLIPTEDLLQALKAAALMGVDVRINIPERPDKRPVYYCSKSYVRELLEAGVKISMLNGTFQHSKLLLIDDNIGSLGTVNLDVRSLLINFEVTGFFYEHQAVQAIETFILKDLENSTEIDLEQWKKRPVHEKIMEFLMRVFSPVL